MTERWPDAGGAARPETNTGDAILDPEWVDNELLSGPEPDTCLFLGEAVSRGTLRRLVAERSAELEAAGLRRGGAVALYLPPSLAFIVNLFAAWRVGAQATLL